MKMLIGLILSCVTVIGICAFAPGQVSSNMIIHLIGMVIGAVEVCLFREDK